ncbi:MAG: hypothetical protein U9N46_05215 [Euryarchaeota archaeon]|nr:hypothetical protein [Euryarchaeota archaeon]
MRKIGIAVWVLLVIALAGLTAGVQAQGADDGLVAEWHFDEGSGSVLADSSGNGNDGVIHGATWVEGKFWANPFMVIRSTDQEGNDEAHRISQ